MSDTIPHMETRRLSMETSESCAAVMGIGFNVADPEGGWGDLRGIAAAHLFRARETVRDSFFLDNWTGTIVRLY